MNLGDMIDKDGIIPALQAHDKKQALQTLSERAGAITGLDVHDIFTALLQRERLSSTSLGRGIAIPHIKIAGLKKITCL
ncbi:MAG: PTS sugar transporter subunit IIA, partial [Hyphomicrobium sp.]